MADVHAMAFRYTVFIKAYTTPEITNMTAQRPIAFIIDDNRDNIEMIKVMLDIEKFSTRDVNGGADALKWLENNPAPDVIVLDINMPDVDGREVYGYIRQNTKFDGSSVIIVTANGLMAEEMKKIITDADCILQKPFQMPQLQKILQSLYRKIKSGDVARTH